MPVTEVLATTLVVPLDVEWAFATRALKNREFTLVRVISSSGAEGVGFCYSGSRAGHLSTLAVRDLLRDHVIGRDPHEVEAIWDAMFRDSVLHGRRGSVLRAMSAIDIALWDLRSKEVGLPLYSLLGSYRRDTVPAYVSGAYYREGRSPEQLGEELRSYVDMGFRAVKMRVGRLSPEKDAMRVKACREAIGPDVKLFLDANNAWDDATSAIRAIRMFEEYEPGWIEEPVMPDALEASAAIAAAVRTPL